MTLSPRLALLMTLPPLLWAGNAVVGRLVVGSVPPLTRAPQRPDGDWAEFLFVQTLFGLLGAAAAAAGELVLGDAAPIRWNGAVLAALAYIAIGPSIIAYRCWGLGVARSGPALAAFFGNLTPLFAALLSAAVLGEAPRWYHAAAFALIVGGIVVSQPPRRRG